MANPSNRSGAKATAGAAPEAPATVETPAANVAVQQYDAGEGWELGQRAPEDRYQEVGPDGAGVGKISSTPPKGKYATQLAVKGQPVNQATRTALGLDK